jgi:hypothetical protein
VPFQAARTASENSSKRRAHRRAFILEYGPPGRALQIKNLAGNLLLTKLYRGLTHCYPVENRNRQGFVNHPGY